MSIKTGSKIIQSELTIFKKEFHNNFQFLVGLKMRSAVPAADFNDDLQWPSYGCGGCPKEEVPSEKVGSFWDLSGDAFTLRSAGYLSDKVRFSFYVDKSCKAIFSSFCSSLCS